MRNNPQILLKYSLFAFGAAAGMAVTWSIVTLRESATPPRSPAEARPAFAVSDVEAVGSQPTYMPFQPFNVTHTAGHDIAHIQSMTALEATRRLEFREAASDVGLSYADGGIATSQTAMPHDGQAAEAMPPLRRILIEPKPRAVRVAFPVRVAPLLLELAPGMRQPAALAEPTEEMTAAQAGAAAEIAEDFTARVEDAVASQTEEEVADVWDAQQADADSQFRNIFGEAAFHLKQAAAAVGSLGLPVE